MKKLKLLPIWITAFLLAFSALTCTAQINSTVKALESLNADSVTIRNYLRADSMANRETGWVYFNVQSNKWRLGWWSTGQAIRWQDIGSSNSTGTGNVSGNLTSPRIPRATALHTLADDPNHVWDTSQDREINSNDAGTQNTYTFGGQTTWDEPSTQDVVTVSVGNGGNPSIAVTETTATNTLTLDNNGLTVIKPTAFTIQNSNSLVMQTTTAASDITITSNNGAGSLVTVQSGENIDVTAVQNLGLNGSNINNIASQGFNVTANIANQFATTDFDIASGTTFVRTIAPRIYEVSTDSVALAAGHAGVASEIDVTFNKIRMYGPHIGMYSTSEDIVIQGDDSVHIESPNLIRVITPGILWQTFGANINTMGVGGSFTVDGGTTGVSIGESANVTVETTTGNIGLSTGNGGTGTGGINISTGAGGTISIQTNALGDITIRSNGATGISMISDTGKTQIQNGVISGPALFGPTGNATLNFGSTLSLGETTLTTTISGQSNGDGCQVTAPINVGVYTCNVASGTVNVVFHNTTAGTVDPASGSYKIVLVK